MVYTTPLRSMSRLQGSMSIPQNMRACIVPRVVPRALHTTRYNVFSTSTEESLGSQYQKKSQREHILLRPEPYLGAIDVVTEKQWIQTSPFLVEHDDIKTQDVNDSRTPRIVESDVTFNPALYKIVDEILVNSADNVHRNNGKTKMTYIDVHVDPNTGYISVENNGASIPVVMHAEEECYVPELIFGHLLTSSNYNDSVDRFTGGRHGYGAKLTNIYSQRFTVEVLDSERKVFYSQTFRDNMSICEPPVIVDSKQMVKEKAYLPNDKNGNLTRVSFIPDFRKFPGVDGLDSSMVRLIHRRVVDLAASLGNKGVRVYLNGVCIPVTSLQKYMKLCPIFIGEGNTVVESDQEVDTTEDTDEQDGLDNNSLQTKGKMLYFDLNEHWSIAIGPRHDDDPHTFASMRQLSFVNNISTGRGGTHVNYIADTIARAVCGYMNDPARKKRWKITNDITPGQVKSRMSLMVSCTISNPAFDSQTKELLMTPIRPPGSNMYSGKGVEGVKLEENVLLNICKNSGLVGLVTEYVQTKETRDVARKMDSTSRGRVEKNKLLNIDKLEDAHLAGSLQHSNECTLILTEGDSAKALALSGLAVLGRQKYGVFPLKGKQLNVRDASVAQLSNNKEVQDLMQILGIRRGDISGLRYGHVVVMADQDHDGSHIKGQLLNQLQVQWPELQERKTFLRQFVTPIVKASYLGSGILPQPSIPGLNVVTIKKEHGVMKRIESSNDVNMSNSNVTAAVQFDGKTFSFYSLLDYQLWKSGVDNPSKYKVKYYKGQGTSTSQEGREYFSQLSSHLIDFIYATQADSAALQLAFAKDQADARKEWVQGAREGSVEAATSTVSKESGLKQVTVSDFVHHELVQFSLADNMRSIPSLVDGLKPGQRKIQYGCLKRNLTKEVKVAQLSGYIAEHTAYHHGEQSLNATIVTLAQHFPFSNNIALLEPLGQFGTRSMGGKDSASSRYIFTKLAPITRKLYRQEDDVILAHNYDDGMLVEPKHYYPILPVILVNGTVGIGTGYSSSIPSYHPKDLMNAVRAELQNQPMATLVPWAHGFIGDVIPESTVPSEQYTDGIITRFMTCGKYSINHKKYAIHVTELPWGVWNSNYKQFLISLQETSKVKKSSTTTSPISTKKTGPTLINFTEHHTENTVAFTLYFKKDEFTSLLQSDILASLKLNATVATTNMHLFDANGQITVYKDPRDIVKEYVQVRLAAYKERKAKQLIKLQLELAIAKSKVAFIKLVSSSKLQLAGKKKEVLVRELYSLGFLPFNMKNIEKEGSNSVNDTNNDSSDSNNTSNNNNNEETHEQEPVQTKGHVIIDTTYTKDTIYTQYKLDEVHHSGIPFAFAKKQIFLHANAFDYLLNLPISSLTKERADAIETDSSNISAKVVSLQNSTPQDIWISELRELEDYLDKNLRLPENTNCLTRKQESKKETKKTVEPTTPAKKTRSTKTKA